LPVAEGREHRHVADSWVPAEVTVDLDSGRLAQWSDEEEAFLVRLVTPSNGAVRHMAGDPFVHPGLGQFLRHCRIIPKHVVRTKPADRRFTTA
jgi:hypothetical protein